MTTCAAMREYHEHRQRTVRRRIEIAPGVELCVHIPMQPATLAALEDVARCVARNLLRVEAGLHQAPAAPALRDVDGGRRGD